MLEISIIRHCVYPARSTTSRIFLLEPAQWTRIAADISELCVEVRAQTPADVGKDKMDRGSIDKICATHLIIPRLLRMPRMTKENFFERPVEGVRLCSFSCSSSRGRLETYRSGRSNLEVECLNAILDTAGLELVTMRPQGPIVGCGYQTGHTMLGRGLNGSYIHPAGRWPSRVYIEVALAFFLK